MKKYTVRSTYTGAESAARRAADVVITLFLCGLAVFAFFYFFFVPVETAEPRVQGIDSGDMVLVDRLAKYFTGFKAGDIVRADMGSGMTMYRVAAVGGSEITVRGGRLYVDGALLEEPYASGLSEDADAVFTVGDGMLLLLPDDRQGMNGWDIASSITPVAAIYGKVRLRIYPINKLNLYV